ncbi:SDR family NAD(P)-dependent oxidoreductase [Novosphingobium sp.]|uniref:SDR family NAD(P)-dependent oxidoreductase n=1 Tax=Novosphingobium sp. TaxID=1874826 RepID=UPI003342BB24
MAGAQTVAWITGASSGIGAALARAWAAQGTHLVLSGRNHDALTAVADDLAAKGVETLVLPFEVTDHAALLAAAQTAWDWAATRSGGIDVLVNNAGISQRSLAVDTDYAVYERIVAVDLMAPIALTQALLPRMVARGAGRIVMMASVAGKVGVPMRTAYCAAKFGLVGYADALRSEIAAAGLSVHVVAPGSVRTNVSRNALTADGTPRATSDRAIENGLDPDVVAQDIVARVAAGEREIIIAEGLERDIAELRRTPDALFDKIAVLAQGYAERMAREA